MAKIKKRVFKDRRNLNYIQVIFPWENIFFFILFSYCVEFTTETLQLVLHYHQATVKYKNKK